ncbi:MAG: YihY/virulence factor BrkB family protein [Gemmatimonadales bacterium]|nr:YihY/virulence factor BrkB family protein [Gemmatimonadales bacterium]
MASALTFDALLAAVPFVLLLLVGLTHLAQAIASGPAIDAAALFHRFFPDHTAVTDSDPFEVVEGILGGITRNRGQISLYAAPAFIWLSTRLFAGVRTSLNEIYDVSLRPPPRRHFLMNLLLAKLRDIGMVLLVVLLFLGNTVLTTGLVLVQAAGAVQVPEFEFFVSTLGQIFGEVLAFTFSVSLFYFTYRYASVRRLPWRTALLGATFTAVLFELAKRFYALYLANFASAEGQLGDANIGAAVLFVLWIYYTAIVFLLGAVVAETWELRKMQHRQRIILSS